MPLKAESSKTLPIRPDTGPAALLRAIGLAAVQIGPGVVALQTKVKPA